MWKLLYESVAGVSHERSPDLCQDSSFGSIVRCGHESVLVVACADGAGSAQFASEGSALAAKGIVLRISDEVEKGLAVRDIALEHFVRWYRSIRQEIETLASERETVPREFASTLLTAIVGEQSAVFAQVGDGAIVRRSGERFEPVFWPQSGEYANVTNFITDPESDGKIEFALVDARVEDVALFSDGLQMLALNFSKKEVHTPFFSPMFRALKDAPNVEELRVGLREFLDSPKVNERTTDDKTLVLASRFDVESHVEDSLL